MTHSDCFFFFFLMIRRPPRSTLDRSSAASDVYKRQAFFHGVIQLASTKGNQLAHNGITLQHLVDQALLMLSLIHISEPTRPY